MEIPRVLIWWPTDTFLQGGKFANAEASNLEAGLHQATEFDVCQKSKSSLPRGAAYARGPTWTNSAMEPPLPLNREVKSAICMIPASGLVHCTKHPCPLCHHGVILQTSLGTQGKTTFPFPEAQPGTGVREDRFSSGPEWSGLALICPLGSGPLGAWKVT